jgi:alginate O-acetyltransferase complex protein AlgI
MVFSSNLFVFVFIPAFFFIYYVLPARFKNPFILVVSLFFYEFGAGYVVLFLIVSILLNYFTGRAIESSTTAVRHAWFWSAVAINVGALVYYKYAGFIWEIGNDATAGSLAAHGFGRPEVTLPIGISFFTFQGLSYIADIYLRHSKSARTLDEFGMYHSLFPQLIAGPIVRFVEIREEIEKRRISLDMVSAGLMRFTIGLAKKIVIADNVGIIVDAIFKLDAAQLSPSAAWLGVAAYAIQILFDFSGYSDMAIGLGLMLGFHFPENFDAPYQASSVTEFWRRWHMTLTRWFRDYVYIPLGGNRAGRLRTYLNLVTVFFLCGLWHGAAYTFVIWGLFHGALLIIERVLRQQWNVVPSGLVGQVWTLLMVLVGWVFFRSTSLSQAMAFLGHMTLLAGHKAGIPTAINFLPPDRALYLLLGIVIALTPLQRLFVGSVSTLPTAAAARLASLLLFVYTVIQLSANTFNPFIYFRF